MHTDEEAVRALVRHMHETAATTPWSLSPEDIRAQRRRRVLLGPHPKALVAVAGAVVLAAVLVGLHMEHAGDHPSHAAIAPASTTTTFGGSPRVGVPTIVGLTELQARAVLGAAGLGVGQIHIAASAQDAGVVISQDPGPGSVVPDGSEVSMAVSSGPPPAVQGGVITRSGPQVTTPVRPLAAAPIMCLDSRHTAREPRAGWLPDRGGVIDYNPDSSDRPVAVPSGRTDRLAATLASTLGHGYTVSRVGENRTPTCVAVRWALVHDHALNSVYLALLRLDRPVDPSSFPFLGTSTDRHRLGNGTEILSSHTGDGGVVTVVAVRSDGLAVLIQSRRAHDEEGDGYPTTVTLQAPPRLPPAGPAPISVARATRAGLVALTGAER
jgi:hypothetical protein